MPELVNQKQLRQVQNLSFCYLCGMAFDISESAVTQDHVPAKCVFATEDRQPLLLPAHRICNGTESVDDELLGQLIAVAYGQYPRRDRRRLNVTHFQDEHTDEEFIASDARVVLTQVWRWVRGFHAALYAGFLDVEANHFISLPFPGATRQDGVLTIKPVLPFHACAVAQIKRSRVSGRIDRILTNHDKCRYECTWLQLREGEWSCLFGLQLYDWRVLGDASAGPVRGCVGWYSVPTPPLNASKVTELEVPFSNAEPLDPFGR